VGRRRLRARSSGRLIKPGYIAAVREVTLHIERLDQLDAPLLIRAQRIAEQPDSQMYRFSLEVGGSPEIEGRIAIFFRGEGAELLRP
jgi:predicted hotdog family 3-hydroxylacyl-ACP dehydratase